LSDFLCVEPYTTARQARSRYGQERYTGSLILIAYNNDFKFMMILTLCSIPLLLLLRGGRTKPDAGPASLNNRYERLSVELFERLLSRVYIQSPVHIIFFRTAISSGFLAIGDSDSLKD